MSLYVLHSPNGDVYCVRHDNKKEIDLCCTALLLWEVLIIPDKLADKITVGSHYEIMSLPELLNDNLRRLVNYAPSELKPEIRALPARLLKNAFAGKLIGKIGEVEEKIKSLILKAVK